MMSTSSVPSITSSTGERGTPLPVPPSPVPGPFRMISPSQAVAAVNKYTDSELRHKNPDELVGIIRQLESENRSIMAEHSSIIKDVNRRIQMYNLEMKGLKDINQKLQDDNQELRDLCCFLDDDRQRGRKLAREWQRFGRYTASVMRSEVSSYQEKLAALEKKQDELINDNMELKELCLYLDQERVRFMQTRDEGDGSSNSTTAGNEEYHHLLSRNDVDVNFPDAGDRHLSDQRNDSRGGHSGQGKEESPQNCSSSELRGTPVGNNGDNNNNRNSSLNSNVTSPPMPSSSPMSLESPQKPEAVVHAMKVLEVHEQLEREKNNDSAENLDDKEKAIVREMCNVVWRKLGDVGSERSTPQAGHFHNYENVSYRGAISPPQQTNTFSPPSPKVPPATLPPKQDTSSWRHNNPPPSGKGQYPTGYGAPPTNTHYSPPQQNPPSTSSYTASHSAALPPRGAGAPHHTGMQQHAGQPPPHHGAPYSSSASHSGPAPHGAPYSNSAPQSGATPCQGAPPYSGSSRPSHPPHSGAPHYTNPPLPGVSQTVHSNAVPSHQQYRSPPPNHPVESISASTTTTYINDPPLDSHQPNLSHKRSENSQDPSAAARPYNRHPPPVHPSHPSHMYPHTRSVSQSPLPRPQSSRMAPTTSKHYSESDLQHAASMQYGHSSGDLRSYRHNPRDPGRHHPEHQGRERPSSSLEMRDIRNTDHHQQMRASNRSAPDFGQNFDPGSERRGPTGNMSYH